MVLFEARNWCICKWDELSLESNIIIIVIVIVIIPINEGKDNRKHPWERSAVLVWIKQLIINLIVPPPDYRTSHMIESNQDDRRRRSSLMCLGMTGWQTVGTAIRYLPLSACTKTHLTINPLLWQHWYRQDIVIISISTDVNLDVDMLTCITNRCVYVVAN